MVRLDGRPAPPLHGASSEAARNTLVAVAIIGTLIYAVSAARYWVIFRHSRNLLRRR
jgi:hypothetical protein